MSFSQRVREKKSRNSSKGHRSQQGDGGNSCRFLIVQNGEALVDQRKEGNQGTIGKGHAHANHQICFVGEQFF